MVDSGVNIRRPVMSLSRSRSGRKRYNDGQRCQRRLYDTPSLSTLTSLLRVAADRFVRTLVRHRCLLVSSAQKEPNIALYRLKTTIEAKRPAAAAGPTLTRHNEAVKEFPCNRWSGARCISLRGNRGGIVVLIRRYSSADRTDSRSVAD